MLAPVSTLKYWEYWGKGTVRHVACDGFTIVLKMSDQNQQGGFFLQISGVIVVTGPPDILPRLSDSWQAFCGLCLRLPTGCILYPVRLARRLFFAYNTMGAHEQVYLPNTYNSILMRYAVLLHKKLIRLGIQKLSRSQVHTTQTQNITFCQLTCKIL